MGQSVYASRIKGGVRILEASQERMFKVLSDIEEMCNADKSFAALNVPATESKSVLAYEFRVQNGILRMIPLFDIHYGLMVCDERDLKTLSNTYSTMMTA